MIRKELITFLFLGLLAVFSVKCSKENIGCTDQNASNYDVDATKEGYCQYPDTLLVWFSINTRNTWKEYDTAITHFRIYFTLDYYSDPKEVFMGEYSIDDYWVEAPSATNTMAIVKFIENQSSYYSLNWVLCDQDDNVLTYDFNDSKINGVYCTEL